MNDLNTVAAFLGWCSILNLGLLSFTSIFLAVAGDFVAGIHSKLFKIEVTELPTLYFKYLANYKILIIVFNLMPYIALKIIS